MWCCISPLSSKLRGTAADLKDCSRNSIRCSLTLPVELERVPSEPAGPPRAALGLGELPPLADASGSLAGGGEAAQLPVLHDGFAHPVDLGELAVLPAAHAQQVPQHVPM